MKAKGDGSKYGKRHKPGEMNRTEAAYADLLQMRKLAGEVIEWHFEAVTLKIADNLRYTPDFVVYLADFTVEMVDCKGGIIDPKSIVKIKAAAERFFQFAFVIEQQIPKKAGGGWRRREF
jgi:hypothetical protein